MNCILLSAARPVAALLPRAGRQPGTSENSVTLTVASRCQTGER